jgi:hypothetical protein
MTLTHRTALSTPDQRHSMIQYVSSFRYAMGLAVVLPLAAACGGESGSASGAGGGAGSGGAGSGGAGSGGAGVNQDTAAPAVISTYPASAAMGTASNGAITATFNEAMDPLSINGETFTLSQGSIDIPGVVTYFNNKAQLLPSSDLALSTTYTATLTTALTDLAGNKLEANYSWSFTTDAISPKGPAPVLLGAAGDYVILAKSAISNVPTSVITGDIGLSPAAASFITGFSLTRAGFMWTAPQVIGGVFAADNDPPTPTKLTTAIGDMQTAYTDAAGRPTPDALNLGDGAIGGLTIIPGLYTWTSSVTIPSDVELSGAPNDVWIFQITNDLKISSGKSITLSGGAQAKNIFWQVAGFVELGTTAHAEGIVLSKTAIKLGTGASINGRLFAQTAVNIDSSTVTKPAP